MKSTRDKAREFILNRDFKNALKLCRKFDQIYNKEERRILEIAYECYTGNEEFYKSLDINTIQNKKEAIDLLKRMKPHDYILNTKKLG